MEMVNAELDPFLDLSRQGVFDELCMKHIILNLANCLELLVFLTQEEKEEVIKNEPDIVKYIRKMYGATEYINNKERYCLWLVGASPAEI